MATHPNGAGGRRSARGRQSKGPTLFAAFSRFIVRYRWLVIVAWLVGAFALATSLPSLGSVAGNGNATFLPDSSPSVRADAMAATFQSATYGTATFIAAVPGGTLSGADDAAVDRAEQAMRKVPRVLSVTDQGVSANGTAREALVMLDVPAGSSDADGPEDRQGHAGHLHHGRRTSGTGRPPHRGWYRRPSTSSSRPPRSRV